MVSDGFLLTFCWTDYRHYHHTGRKVLTVEFVNVFTKYCTLSMCMLLIAIVQGSTHKLSTHSGVCSQSGMPSATGEGIFLLLMCAYIIILIHKYCDNYYRFVSPKYRRTLYIYKESLSRISEVQ